MDKLACMRAYVSVVEGTGFSEAARRLGVSKALISKQVSQLEDSLGVRLLHRTTRRVSPTSSGRAYFEQCRRLLDEFEELDASMQSATLEPRGELLVAAPITFAEMHLMSVVAEFSGSYPAVTVKLDLTDRFVDLVDEQIDVAIRIGQMSDSSMVIRRLGNVSMLVCASPDYLAANGVPDHPQQLSEHQCIIDSNYPGGDHWVLGQGDRTVTTQVHSRIRVNSARAARELVLSGYGIGYLPSFAVAEDVSLGRLTQLLSDDMPEPLGIYATYLHRKHLSAKVRLFIDRLIEHGKLNAYGMLSTG